MESPEGEWRGQKKGPKNIAGKGERRPLHAIKLARRAGKETVETKKVAKTERCALNRGERQELGRSWVYERSGLAGRESISGPKKEGVRCRLKEG